MSQHLENQRKQAPDMPGVYTFKDQNQRPLYIGKAKSLRKRLYSHFQNPSTAGGKSLIDMTVELDWIVCDSEWQALLLEQSMILKEQPRFNVRLRTGHNYPYIAVSFDEEYPRVYLTREKRKKGRSYFGPYETKYARKLLDILGRIFQYRTCDGPTPGRRSGSPCLDYSIERCTAPCVEYISKENYNQSIKDLVAFLNGNQKTTLENLEAKMRFAAKHQQFEKAAAIRDRWKELESLLSKGKINGLSPSSNFDAIGFACFENKAQIQLLIVREGNLQERRSYGFENLGEASGEEIVRDFLLRHYDQTNVPSLITVPKGTNDLKHVETYLNKVKKAKVELREAQKGQGKQMVDLAIRNAKIALQKALVKQEKLPEDVKYSMHSALVDLSGYLEIEKTINRIECYDISNLGPTHVVSAMVVFENGGLLPSDYRRFKIQNSGQNDFEALKETLTRRVKSFNFNKQLDQKHRERDPSFARLPDLVIIDGGKGQLSAVEDALEPFKKLGVKIISLAKKEEEIFFPGKSKPLLIEQSEPVSLLLQRIRDETHRFVITYHRNTRDKTMLVSELDKVKGLGPKRRAQLIKAFGTPNNVKKARQEDLEKIVPKNLAKEIFTTFNKRSMPLPPAED